MAFATRRVFGGKYYAFEYMGTREEANKYAKRRREKGKKVRIVKGKSKYGVYTRDY